jgi:Fic family protein
LAQRWADQKTAIEGEELIVAFNQELAREWSIETGIIEGAYTLDRGITQTLIERGIDSSFISHDSTNRDPELVARIIQAHQAALEGLFIFVRGERELGTSYIKELHAALLEHADTVVVFDQFGKAFETTLEKGAYKKFPNNPRRQDGAIHEYCPPEHVASEVDRLIELHRHHRARGVAVHIQAAWLHHAFTQIHPFQDGNGRVARALASLVFISGGMFPLIVTRDDRAKYIERLELADAGDLGPLVELFSQFQKRALKGAIARAADIKPVTSLSEAIEVTRDMLQGIGMIGAPEQFAAKENADEFKAQTVREFMATASKLNRDISRHSQFDFAAMSGSVNAADLKFLSERFAYDPNPSDYSKVVSLRLRTKTTTNDIFSDIIVVFQTEGPVFRGLIAVVAYFRVGENTPIPLSEEVFRIDYREHFDDLLPRYCTWLDQAVTKGLAEWRRTFV